MSVQVNNENDYMEVAEFLYYKQNPETTMDVPNSVYLIAEKWFTEWINKNTELTFLQWCLIVKAPETK